jgi:hypothetical protein
MLIQVGLRQPGGEGREGAVLGKHEPPLSVECRWEDRRATVVVRGEVDFATVGILARQRQVRLVLEVSGLAGECPIEDPPS